MEQELTQELPQEQQPMEQAQAEPVEQQETGEQPQATPAPVEAPEDRRIKGIEAALVAERRKRQELEAAIAKWQQQQQEPPKAEAEPDPANYQDANQYWRDLARFEARQQAKALLDEQRKAYEQAQAEAAQRAEVEAFEKAAASAVARGQAKYQDFDAAINTGLAPYLNPAMQQVLVSRPDGHDVAYHLARNPAEAARLSQLPPLLMAAEIGAIAKDIAAPKAPEFPRTLTQTRDARGQFAPAYAGPTPLDAIFKR